MPSRALIEASVVTAVEAVLSGGSVEDSRIECKSKLMPPDRVRQLAGAANAAFGEDIIWIVGIDETAKALTPLDRNSIDLADWWAQVEARFDSSVAPDLTPLWVPVTGGTVLALHFSTDRAPYVVKVPSEGKSELEVPWRSGTRTRSARRHELLKILLPSASTPGMTVIACSGKIADGPEGTIEFNGQANLYVEHIHNSTTVLPAHQMQCRLELWGAEIPIRVRPVINVTAIDSGGVETLRDGIYCTRSGVVRLELYGSLGELQPDTDERLRDLDTVGVRLDIGVAASPRSIKKHFLLRSTYEPKGGPTLRVPLQLEQSSEDGEQ